MDYQSNILVSSSFWSPSSLDIFGSSIFDIFDSSVAGFWGFFSSSHNLISVESLNVFNEFFVFSSSSLGLFVGFGLFVDSSPGDCPSDEVRFGFSLPEGFGFVGEEEEDLGFFGDDT